MKKIWLIIVYILWGLLWLRLIFYSVLSFTSCNNDIVEESDNTLIFSWNLREDADLFYTIKWTSEWSGWR